MDIKTLIQDNPEKFIDMLQELDPNIETKLQAKLDEEDNKLLQDELDHELLQKEKNLSEDIDKHKEVIKNLEASLQVEKARHATLLKERENIWKEWNKLHPVKLTYNKPDIIKLMNNMLIIYDCLSAPYDEKYNVNDTYKLFLDLVLGIADAVYMFGDWWDITMIINMLKFSRNRPDLAKQVEELHKYHKAIKHT